MSEVGLTTDRDLSAPTRLRSLTFFYTSEIVTWYEPLYNNSYVYFRINTLEKGMNLLILPAMDKIVPLLFLYGDGFDIK